MNLHLESSSWIFHLESSSWIFILNLHLEFSSWIIILDLHLESSSWIFILNFHLESSSWIFILNFHLESSSWIFIFIHLHTHHHFGFYVFRVHPCKSWSWAGRSGPKARFVNSFLIFELNKTNEYINQNEIFIFSFKPKCLVSFHLRILQPHFHLHFTCTLNLELHVLPSDWRLNYYFDIQIHFEL